jgi:hypothetical protein
LVILSNSGSDLLGEEAAVGAEVGCVDGVEAGSSAWARTATIKAKASNKALRVFISISYFKP